MMNKSFNNFIKRKQMTEAAGRAGHLSPAKKRLSSLSLPTSYPGLSSFLNLIHNDNIRRKFLIWIVGEGLMKASKGRENLLKTLKENPQKILKEENLDFSKYQRLKEMARDIRVATLGREAGREVITSHDLFSPKAREENKELATMSQKIDDYYEKNYEPKEAIIDVPSGGTNLKHIRIDLELLREKCRELNLPEFKYGGTGGYLQYVEKGDYLSKELKERDALNINKQYGPDLRPDESSKDDNGEFLPTTTVNKNTGNHVYHFMGGHYEEVPKQMNAVLQNMRSDYSKAMSDQSRTDELENFKRFGKKIDNFEEFENYLANEKGNILNKIGLPDFDEAPDEIPIPDFVNEESFKKIIMHGIEKVYTDITELDRIKIFNGIFSRDGFVKTRLRLNTILPDSGKNQKVLLGSLLTKSFEDKTFLKDLFNQGRLAIYTSSGQSHGPDLFSTSKKSYKIDVNFDNPNDTAMGNKFLEELISNGYYWKKTSSSETSKINKNPFIDNNLNKLFLTNNKNYFLVYRDKNNNFFIDMPDTNEIGKKLKSGSLANPVFGSPNNMIRGRSSVEHYYANPGSPQQHKNLIEQLKRGLLGEAPEKVNNFTPEKNWEDLPILFNKETDLPSVVQGCKYAKQLSKRNHMAYFNNNANAWNSWYENVEPSVLMSAINTLKLISNERAFQSGWITDNELNAFKRRIKKTSPESNSKRGFKKLEDQLEKYGLEPETIRNLQKISAESEGGIGDQIPHEGLRKILGRNAQLWRINTIGQNAKLVIDRELNKIRGNQIKSIDAPTQDPNLLGIASNVAKKGYGYNYDNATSSASDNTSPLGSDQIKDLIQQHGLTTAEIPNASKDNIRRSTRVSKPIPKFDPSMIKYKDQSSVAATPTTPKFDPSMIKYKTESFISYNSWKQKNEMVGTYVVSPKKPKDGCGYNIWGAAGKPAVSITGEPIKKKKKNGR